MNNFCLVDETYSVNRSLIHLNDGPPLNSFYTIIWNVYEEIRGKWRSTFPFYWSLMWMPLPLDGFSHVTLPFNSFTSMDKQKTFLMHSLDTHTVCVPRRKIIRWMEKKRRREIKRDQIVSKYFSSVRSAATAQ